MNPLEPNLPRLFFVAGAMALASCGADHSSGGTDASGGELAEAGDAGAADTQAPDAVPDAGADGATPDAGANDTGVADADASLPDTGLEAGPEDGASSDGPTDSGASHGCDLTDPLATTRTCFEAQSRPSPPGQMLPSCLDCAMSNGCFDPKQQGGTCEMLSGALTHLSGSIGDGGPTCATVIGTEPVSEKQICMRTLQMIFSSKCAATLQLTPCLCGTTDPTMCLPGQVTPNGPLYDLYACDYDTPNGQTINTNFIVPTFGAGMANSIAECAGAFSCPCF
jgi:hypothetical protein